MVQTRDFVLCIVFLVVLFGYHYATTPRELSVNNLMKNAHPCPACPACPTCSCVTPTCTCNCPNNGEQQKCPEPQKCPTQRRPLPHTKRAFELIRQFGIDCEAKDKFFAGVPDVLMVEVGAYDGSEALKYGSLSHVKKLISYEATPSKIPEIRRKISGLGDKVIIRNAAVTNFSGEITFYIPNGAGGSEQDSTGNQKFWSGNTHAITVPAVRLDEEIKERIHFLKSDTQGGEFHVLLGAEKIIDNYGIDVLHLEFSPNLAVANGENLEEMMEWLQSKGYVCFDCNSHIPPAYDEEHVRKLRSFATFPKSFGDFHYNQGNHGAWSDIVCLQTR